MADAASLARPLALNPLNMTALFRHASLLTLATLVALPCHAQQDADVIKDGPAIAYEDAFPGQDSFKQPLFVAFHETDAESAYVVTQPGFIYRIPRDGQKSEREVFLDLSKQVFTENWEEGLLGFQFDPDYANNHFVWTYWSEKIEARTEPMGRGKRKSNRQSIIARYTVKEAGGKRSVDLSTELRVLEVFQPFGNHNGGTILFGPDSMLYITFGDGGAANDPYGNSESLAMLLGKVLRIDVRNASADEPYKIPKDNPFVATEGARGEIWCYGLRNIWRMSFDRETNELWAGDVGQGRIEEVDRLVKGGFYGWNTYEAHEEFGKRRGKQPTPKDHILPIASYAHSEGVSITGGHVYRGKKIPGLQGYFVYADFITKRAWACREGKDGGQDVVRLKSAAFPPSSYAEEPDGELLMTVFIGKKGKIFRLVPASE
ncbi:MAG: glucose/arabinose dehydrogenase [Neolewinella sp.]|jgi:glucose/arabinose dehydrogenase